MAPTGITGGVEFLVLGGIGLFATLYVGNREFAWFEPGPHLTFDPFEFSNIVLSHLNATESATLLYRNVILLSLCLFNCLFLELNRTIMKHSNPVYVILMPLLCFILGPSTVLPFITYYVCRCYKKITLENFADTTKTNDVIFERVFYVFLLTALLVVYALWKIPASAVHRGPVTTVPEAYTDVIVYIAAGMSFMIAFDYSFLDARRTNVLEDISNESEEVPKEVASHYVAMMVYIMTLLVGLCVHLHSLFTWFTYSDGDFMTGMIINPTSALFLLNYAVIFGTCYLWLDGFSTVLLGPAYYKDGIITWRDIPPMILLGPTVHFSMALISREGILLDLDNAKLGQS